MTSVPGVDHPEEQTEAEVTLSGRGISVSSRVEVVQNEYISVRPSVGEFVDQVVVKVGDVVELFWKTDDAQRALPAEVTDVEQGAVIRWRMRATGPAEASQRRKAVRGRVTVPVVAEYGSIELKGETVDLSEAGLRAEFEGLGAPPEAGAKLDLFVKLEDGARQDQGRGRAHPGPRCPLGDVDPVRQHPGEGPGPRPPPGLPGAARGAGAARPTTPRPTSGGSRTVPGQEAGCDLPAAPADRCPDGTARPAGHDPARPGHPRPGRRPSRCPGRRRPDRRLPAAAAARSRRPAADRRRRLDRRGQVHARQQPGRRPRDHRRGAAADHPRARCWSAPAPTSPPSPATACSPGCPASPARPAARAPCSSSSATTCPPGWPCSTPRTSTRWSSPTGNSPASCWRRPTSGSSSRRRPATPTPCRGTCSGRRRSAAPRSPSCSTGCRPRPSAEVARRPRRDAAPRRAGRRPAVRRRGAPAGRRAAARGPGARRCGSWLHALAADQEARAAVVRQTLTGALDSLEQRVAGIADGRRGAGRRRRGAAGRGGRRLRRGPRGHRRGRPQRHAAARGGAGPLAGVRRHRRVDARPAGPGRAGCATGS